MNPTAPLKCGQAQGVTPSPGRKHISESRRVLRCAVAGVAAGALASLAVPWQIAMILGWIVAATSMLVWLKHDLWTLDPDQTQDFSAIDDDSRATSSTVVVVGSLASLVAVILGVINARADGGFIAVATIVASICAVIASFALVHAVFALQYLHAYFGAVPTPGGTGLEFPGTPRPQASDFAYFAFTIGMSFAVSDVDVTDVSMRRRILGHALVSYAFASAILGFAINLFAGLLG